jgi:signal transduction histidine kinase
MLPEKLAEIQTQGSGVGISGIRERLRHFGGELIVDSNGSGTKVYAILPLPTPLSWPKSSTEQVVA